MFNFFKNLFGQNNSAEIIEAIKNDAFLVDVRSPQEFAQGSAKGAVNIPLNQIEAQIQKLKTKKQIVVFCLSGGRSGQAKSILEKNSITNVINGKTWRNVSECVNNAIK